MNGIDPSARRYALIADFTTVVLPLTPPERWMRVYQEALDRHVAGLVSDIAVGFKARGQVTDDSDLGLLVVLRRGEREVRSKVADLGYDLAAMTPVVPSILVVTEEE